MSLLSALWKDNSDKCDALLCALDCVFDDATVFKFKGKSFRGKDLETISLETDKVKSPDDPTVVKLSEL